MQVSGTADAGTESSGGIEELSGGGMAYYVVLKDDLTLTFDDFFFSGSPYSEASFQALMTPATS